MRTVTFGLALAMFGILGAAGGGAASAASEYWIAPNGGDDQPGTQDRPFATLARAQQTVRQQIAKGLTGDVRVTLRGGVYRLEKPLVLSPEDSGTSAHRIGYAAAANERVIVSGGRSIGGWRAGEGGAWVADVPEANSGKWAFTQLWVNGRRAVRARTPNADDANPHWQLASAELSPDLKKFTVRLAPGLLKPIARADQVEAMIVGNWEINRKRVAKIDATSGVVELAPPHIGGPEYIQPAAGRWCYFENAIEMLDRPGEWFLDTAAGKLHYRPRDGEDMTRALVIAPVLAQLVQIRGAEGRPVRNVHFTGITFACTDWPIPAGGYQGIQACHYNTAGSAGQSTGRILAAVDAKFAEGCSVEDGALVHLGGCGIELGDGCVDNLVQGNRITDVAGNGVNVGGGVPKGNRVLNNHVFACGQLFYGAVGIWVGIAERTTVAHNLVHDLPYTGISVGWEWSTRPTPCRENVVEANHVYNVMNRLCDGGCIYTLGWQPGTIIRGNHLHGVHRSQFAQGAPNNGMFIDEGSKGYLFEKNVIYDTAAELVRFNACQREWHTWRDNHIGDREKVLAAGKETVDAAGPQPPYRQRFAR
jgi:hypothetical protein